MISKLYTPSYSSSWALVIGINDYKHSIPNLEFALNDAQAFADVLVTQCDFPQSNVTLLRDAEATETAITECYLSFCNKTEPDDRVVFFFAGHGYTTTGHRGQVGFLIPHDGSIDHLESLIPWRYLTSQAELIPAKHILFIMDACYGGLAIARGTSTGSSRFLKDMLRRRVRQVIAAGKANETVSDAGGPLPNHSVFTGHLLQGLEGKAVSSDGVITAQGLMHYVYEQVTRDYTSRQTPHYGYLDGDGDFVFKSPGLDQLLHEEETDEDILVVSLPPADSASTLGAENRVAEAVKEYLANDKNILLDDLVNQLLRNVHRQTSEEDFPLSTGQLPTVEQFVERIQRYESITSNLMTATILIARWGTEDCRTILEKVIQRTAEIERRKSGNSLWLSLRWYPLGLLVYAGGLAAVAANKYENLATIFLAKAGSPAEYEDPEEVVRLAADGITDEYLVKGFRLIPEHKNKHVPVSEYLHSRLQPHLDELLYLSTGYEVVFDKFEILFALVSYDRYFVRFKRHYWGPLGRYAWKHRSWRRDNRMDPYTDLLQEAQSLKEHWLPLQAGLFSGSYERFEEVATIFRENVLDKLDWY